MQNVILFLFAYVEMLKLKSSNLIIAILPKKANKKTEKIVNFYKNYRDFNRYMRKEHFATYINYLMESFVFDIVMMIIELFL